MGGASLPGSRVGLFEPAKHPDYGFEISPSWIPFARRGGRGGVVDDDGARGADARSVARRSDGAEPPRVPP